MMLSRSILAGSWSAATSCMALPPLTGFTCPASTALMNRRMSPASTNTAAPRRRAWGWSAGTTPSSSPTTSTTFLPLFFARLCSTAGPPHMPSTSGRSGNANTWCCERWMCCASGRRLDTVSGMLTRLSSAESEPEELKQTLCPWNSSVAWSSSSEDLCDRSTSSSWRNTRTPRPCSRFTMSSSCSIMSCSLSFSEPCLSLSRELSTWRCNTARSRLTPPSLTDSW
mmetsp:Transcript_22247/g.30487  ORF Transcript_22247/g.30487 Transcript_22247/m.30487 type:complete len:226 (-) Transcript_22247:527-1204(-)